MDRGSRLPVAYWTATETQIHILKMNFKILPVLLVALVATEASLISDFLRYEMFGYVYPFWAIWSALF